MTQRQWLEQARTRLEAHGCPDPAVDAEWLLEAELGTLENPAPPRERHLELTESQASRLEELLLRRCAGEPVQHITKIAWFYGYPFHVDPRALIPRADTENLVEAAEQFLRRRAAEQPQRPLTALDLCTGSGAIGLSLAKRLPCLLATLTDLSPDALAVARLNAGRLGVRAEFLPGDLFAPVTGRRFDLIACNPPYIPSAELAGLQREVQREPALALDGGEDGLDFYRRIAAAVDDHLLPGGGVFLEVGIGQAQAVLALLQAALAPRKSGVIRDLNGIERVVWAQK